MLSLQQQFSNSETLNRNKSVPTETCFRKVKRNTRRKMKFANLCKRLKNAKLGFPKKQTKCFAWDKGVSEQRLMFAVRKLAMARLTTCGELSEWLNVSLSKSDKVKAFGGSNPPLSAKLFFS